MLRRKFTCPYFTWSSEKRFWNLREQINFLGLVFGDEDSKVKQTLDRIDKAEKKANKWENKKAKAEKRLRNLETAKVKLKSAQIDEDYGDINENEFILADGDEIYRVKNKQQMSERELQRTELNAVKGAKRLWPKDPETGIVRIPYYIDNGYSKLVFNSSPEYSS